MCAQRQVVSCVVMLIGSVVIFTGCSQQSVDDNAVLAVANGETIYVKDFKRELAHSYRKDPLYRATPEGLEDQLNVLIDKRLLIQEARSYRLDEEEKFINTIKTFWEQTLIRDLMSRREKEFAESVFVTEEEKRDFYTKMPLQITFSVKRGADRKSLEQLMTEEAQDIAWDETVGPIPFADASQGVIVKAFSLEQGERGIIEQDGIFYLIVIREKRVLPVKPYEEIHKDICRKLESLKMQRQFQDWIKAIKDKSKITIDRDALKGMVFRHAE